MAVLSTHVGVLRTLLTNLFILALMIVLCSSLYKKMYEDVVILEPFEVPAELNEKGYNGRVIRAKLRDQIHQIVNLSTPQDYLSGDLKAPNYRSLFNLKWLDEVKFIELPVAGISFKSLLEFLRDLSGRAPKRIIGEVTSLENDRIEVTVRLLGYPPERLAGTLKDLDSLMMESAKYIYKIVEPFVLAKYYYYHVKDTNTSLEWIGDCLRNDRSDDDAWAYNLWGNIFHDIDNHTKEKEMYEKAIESNPKFFQAYTNLAFTLREKGGGYYQDSIKMCKKSLAINPRYERAYIAWAQVLQAQKNYSEASKKFEKAIKINPKFVYTYVYWGHMLLAQKKKDEAIKKYEKIIELYPMSSLADEARKLISNLKAMPVS